MLAVLTLIFFLCSVFWFWWVLHLFHQNHNSKKAHHLKELYYILLDIHIYIPLERLTVFIYPPMYLCSSYHQNTLKLKG